MTHEDPITADRLRELLHYDPNTGLFTWKVSPSHSVEVGTFAGSCYRKGYIKIQIGRRRYSAHRLAFLYMKGEWPTDHVDHRDRNTSNNRWSNLRDATNAQNILNRGRQTNNTSGRAGVHWAANMGKWQARVALNGTRVNLGYFDKIEDAIAARLAAERSEYGAFAPR